MILFHIRRACPDCGLNFGKSTLKPFLIFSQFSLIFCAGTPKFCELRGPAPLKVEFVRCGSTSRAYTPSPFKGLQFRNRC